MSRSGFISSHVSRVSYNSCTIDTEVHPVLFASEVFRVHFCNNWACFFGSCADKS